MRRRVEYLKEQLSKAWRWLPFALCLFVSTSYGIYLLQSYRSALSFASIYNQYISEAQTAATLYFYGKLGLVAFTIVESGSLLWYFKSGAIAVRQFAFLVVLVIVSNLAIYASISYLYGYATTIIE